VIADATIDASAAVSVLARRGEGTIRPMATSDDPSGSAPTMAADEPAPASASRDASAERGAAVAAMNAATLAAAPGDEVAAAMQAATLAATEDGDGDGEPPDTMHAATQAASLAGTASGSLAAPGRGAGLGAADQRYEARALLGRGGMGDVRLCVDGRLGRSVALKTMRTRASASLRTRFLREARLQARLEHPSIVPVYDLGTAADGSPFFTMRRLAGDTLEQVIEGLRAGRPEIVERYRRGRLLSDFVRVCQAIAYAHSRGVIHRDLKPSNVILAEFGEVYVLDWGVAKVLGEAEGETAAQPVGPVELDANQRTADGAVLGTLGYMPPEQLEGAASRVDHRADVYALGAMLFELLALEPLHPRGGVAELVESTLGGGDARASVRAPERDVPPELEAICVRACAREPADRHADVRELVAALQRYVDGDRDQQRRRALADEHAEKARAELRRAATDVDARSRAAAEAGRALAFDPDHREALGVLTRLLLEPPERVPPEVARQLHEADVDSSRAMSRFGGYARVMWLGILAVFLWMGIRSWSVFGVLVGMMLLSIAGSFLASRSRATIPLPLVVLNMAMLTLLATSMGPFVIVPGIAAASTVMFMLGGTHDARLLVALGCTPIVLPFLAEHVGILPMIEDPRGDSLVLHAVLASFPPVPTKLALLAMSLATVLMAGLAVASVRRRLQASRQQQLLLTWHLGRIVPSAKATALP
jgi:hypothetical protein